MQEQPTKILNTLSCLMYIETQPGGKVVSGVIMLCLNCLPFGCHCLLRLDCRYNIGSNVVT